MKSHSHPTHRFPAPADEAVVGEPRHGHRARKHSRRLRWPLIAALVAGSVAPLVVPRPAYADERSDARRHFRTGMEQIAQRRFADGIRELEAAYAILPHPNVLYNIARAYNDMGDTEHALEYLRRYLTHDVSDRAEVEAIIARLEARLRERQGAAAATEGEVGRAGATDTGPAATTAATGPTVTLPSAGGTMSQADALRETAMQLLRAADQAEGHPGATTITTTTNTGQTTTSGTGAAPTGTAAGSGSAAGTAPTIRPPHGAVGAAGMASPTGPTPATVSLAAAATGSEQVYEEQVVTASRAAQSPIDAPNATAIITAQDIRLSGLTNVGELLRRVVGVDVMQLDSGEIQVGIRGFNQRLANKVLVLIDGRSIYLDVLGVTLWPHVFPAVEEIERIEIIRGPGSALYGADAFSGIVNIITRAPGEGRNLVSIGGGNGQWLRGAFVTSGRQGAIAYRASLQYEQRATYDLLTGPNDRTWTYGSSDPEIGTRTPRFMLEVHGRLARDVVLRGGLGASYGDVNFTPTGLLRRFWSRLLFVQPFLQLDAGGFSARVFWNHFSGTAGPSLVPEGGVDLRANFIQNVFDADAQYATTQRIGWFQNTLQVGLNTRWKSVSWNYLDGDHSLWFISAYLSDTARFGEHFSIVASARVDRHPLLETPVFSPRAALIYKPTSRRSIRFTAGTAFRTPTMLEMFFDLYYPTPIPGATVRGLGSEVLRPGGSALAPETVLSLDLGYRDETSDRIQFEANLFWTRGTDLINLTPVTLDTVPGSSSANRAVNLGSRYYANDPGATYVMGAEVGGRLSPIDGLDLFANYTFAYTLHDANSPLAVSIEHPEDDRTPQHKFNVGVQVRTRFGLDFEAFAHYVSQTVWVEPVFDPVQGTRDVGFPLDQYVVLNARLGYRLPGDHVDVGIVGTDLIDVNPGQGHLEHPLGAHLSARVLGTLTYRF